MHAPLLTRSLVERFKQRDLNGALARLNVVKALPCDPYGARAQYRGEALATSFDANIQRGLES